MSKLMVFAIGLLLLALVLRSELIGASGFALGAAWLISTAWLRYTERSIRLRREAPETLPYGEMASVAIVVRNPGVLRIPWIEIRESVPPELRLAAPQPRVVTLGAGQEQRITYQIRGSRRGWYSLGPVRLELGDVLGLRKVRLLTPPAEVTVFPRVLPLPQLGLPAMLSVGPLRPQRPRLRQEDPARPAGVRPYAPGDDVRRLDWKASARQHMLLVRRSDPTIAPETTIALAFSKAEYPRELYQDTMERGVIVATSLAMALLQHKLPVGLVTDGSDPRHQRQGVTIGCGKGAGQRRLLLEVLGRLRATDDGDVLELLGTQPLTWGGTLVVVMVDVSVAHLPRLTALRRRGQQLALVLLDASPRGLVLARQQQLQSYAVDRQGIPMAERGA